MISAPMPALGVSGAGRLVLGGSALLGLGMAAWILIGTEGQATRRIRVPEGAAGAGFQSVEFGSTAGPRSPAALTDLPLLETQPSTATLRPPPPFAAVERDAGQVFYVLKLGRLRISIPMGESYELPVATPLRESPKGAVDERTVQDSDTRRDVP